MPYRFRKQRQLEENEENNKYLDNYMSYDNIANGGPHYQVC